MLNNDAIKARLFEENIIGLGMTYDAERAAIMANATKVKTVLTAMAGFGKRTWKDFLSRYDLQEITTLVPRAVPSNTLPEHIKEVPRYNQRTALAMHFCVDAKEIEWYQPTVNNAVRVFASGDRYYCATHATSTPPKGYKWNEVHDHLLNESGWHIWESADEQA